MHYITSESLIDCCRSLPWEFEVPLHRLTMILPVYIFIIFVCAVTSRPRNCLLVCTKNNGRSGHCQRDYVECSESKRSETPLINGVSCRLTCYKCCITRKVAQPATTTTNGWVRKIIKDKKSLRFFFDFKNSQKVGVKDTNSKTIPVMIGK